METILSIIVLMVVPNTTTQMKMVREHFVVEQAADSQALPTLKTLLTRKINGVKVAEIEARVLKLTNEERARFGLAPLTLDKELMETARSHASWMTLNRSLVHTRLSVAENIAMGQETPDDVVQAWMNSSGHRANILNPNHRRLGLGSFRTESGTIYWCQQFQP
jgi:uncharacterized protein YkwD